MSSDSPADTGDERVKAIFFGVGAIGIEAVKYAIAKEWLQIVGAVDIDKSKAGRDLGDVVGLGRNLGVQVSDDVSSLFGRVEADIVVHIAGSFFKSICGQLEAAVSAGINVITSAEELCFPPLQSPELARKLDDVAKQNGVTVVAAGVNPGFVMDALALNLALACLDVKSVRAIRVVDTSRRRKQLQLKVGAGLSVEEFKTKLGKTIFGHIGLAESAALLADGLNMRPEKITQTIEPVIAERSVSTAHVKVGAGQVAGMRQVARCFADGQEAIVLELQFHLGAPDQRDEILIDGSPRINLSIKDGIAGDQATVALLINSIPSMLRAKPGLLTPTGKAVSDITWRCPVDLGY